MTRLTQNAVFAALGDPTRRALLDALNVRTGQTLRDLSAPTGMSRQAVTKHLVVLEAAGLVVARRRGREKVHFLNAAPIADIADRWIRRYHHGHAQVLADLARQLDTPTPEDTAMTEHDHTSGANPFVYVTYVRTTPSMLWAALTAPDLIRRYYEGSGPSSTWQVGAPVHWSMGPDDGPHDWGQQVVACVENELLSYTWHNYQPEMAEMFGWSDEQLTELRTEPVSTVTFEIEDLGTAVKLTVTHDDFVDGSEMRAGVSEGWPGILSNLKSLLETGEVVAVG